MAEDPDNTGSGADHHWVGAATVPIDDRSARAAHRRGTMRVPADLVVTVLEVYCSTCRRPFAAVAGDVCVIGMHLHGGDPDGKRKRRPAALPDIDVERGHAAAG